MIIIAPEHREMKKEKETYHDIAVIMEFCFIFKCLVFSLVGCDDALPSFMHRISLSGIKEMEIFCVILVLP